MSDTKNLQRLFGELVAEFKLTPRSILGLDNFTGITITYPSGKKRSSLRRTKVGDWYWKDEQGILSPQHQSFPKHKREAMERYCIKVTLSLNSGDACGAPMAPALQAIMKCYNRTQSTNWLWLNIRVNGAIYSAWYKNNMWLSDATNDTFTEYHVMGTISSATNQPWQSKYQSWDRHYLFDAS